MKRCTEKNNIAGPLGLFEEDSSGTPLTAILQGLSRFLLDRIIQDYRSIPPYSTAFEQVDIRYLLAPEYTAKASRYLQRLRPPLSNA